MPRLLLDATPLRVSPAYRRLWLGLSVSNLGGQLTVVAVGLQVYHLTRSTFAVGVLGLFALVPLVVLGLYGGSIADHADRRTVALVASSVAWVAVLGLVAQAIVHSTSVGVLDALVALESGAGAVNAPARGAIIPRLLDPRQMPAANAWQTLGWNIALTVGPLLGAGMVALGGYGLAYGTDALLFTFALAALYRLPPVPPERAAGGRSRAGLGSVLDGLRYLGTQPNVRMTFLVDLAAMVFSSPRVLFPAIGVVYLGGGATTTGALTAAVAVGAVLSGLLSGGLARVRWQGRTIVWSITAWGASIVVLGAVLVHVGRGTPTQVVRGGLVAVLVALAFAGAADNTSAVFRQTILQTATPDDMRGRLQGVFTVVVSGGPRLGELGLGAVSSRLGEGWAAVVGGAACLVVLWLLVVAQPRFWRYDAHDPQP